MKAFVTSNRILFLTDTLSLDWLRSFGLSSEIVAKVGHPNKLPLLCTKKDYSDAKEEAKKSTDASEFTLMKG
jgi:hypothetical protein